MRARRRRNDDRAVIRPLHLDAERSRAAAGAMQRELVAARRELGDRGGVAGERLAGERVRDGGLDWHRRAVDLDRVAGADAEHLERRTRRGRGRAKSETERDADADREADARA